MRGSSTAPKKKNCPQGTKCFFSHDIVYAPKGTSPLWALEKYLEERDKEIKELNS